MAGLERHDEILSIDVVNELAMLKLKLQIPPRYWRIVQKVTLVDSR